MCPRPTTMFGPDFLRPIDCYAAHFAFLRHVDTVTALRCATVAPFANAASRAMRGSLPHPSRLRKPPRSGLAVASPTSPILVCHHYAFPAERGAGQVPYHSAHASLPCTGGDTNNSSSRSAILIVNTASHQPRRNVRPATSSEPKLFRAYHAVAAIPPSAYRRKQRNRGLGRVPRATSPRLLGIGVGR